MFWKKEADAIKKAVKGLVTTHANNSGATRRATMMVPIAAAGEHEIVHTNSVRFHQLLISLEGNQRSGCLRIVSPRVKARSAIMIYRGRVVGCLYGARKLDFHYLHEDAHRYALADLATPGNILDAYELPEELVLAAASLFNGEIIQLEQNKPAEQLLTEATEMVSKTNLPGCVVISTATDEMVCMVYINEGKIIGLYAPAEGWVAPNHELALKMIRSAQSAKVTAAFLPVQGRETMGFSLTGLADEAKRGQQYSTSRLNVPSFKAIGTDASSTYSSAAYAKAQGNMRPKITSKRDMQSPVRSDSVFAIVP